MARQHVVCLVGLSVALAAFVLAADPADVSLDEKSAGDYVMDPAAGKSITASIKCVTAVLQCDKMDTGGKKCDNYDKFLEEYKKDSPDIPASFPYKVDSKWLSNRVTTQQDDKSYSTSKQLLDAGLAKSVNNFSGHQQFGYLLAAATCGTGGKLNAWVWVLDSSRGSLVLVWLAVLSFSLLHGVRS